MAKEFKIALGSLMDANEMTNLGVDINCLNDITDTLWSHLCKVLSHPKAIRHGFTPRVDWFTTAGEIAAHDLVVYFVADPSKSLINKLKLSTSTVDLGGRTAIRTGVGNVSEVFVQNNFPARKLANIAWHELMHNKLQKDDRMHKINGLQIGVSPVQICDFLSDEDRRLMAESIHLAVPQYTAALP